MFYIWVYQALTHFFKDNLKKINTIFIENIQSYQN